MADNITLKCPECGHSNEPERVYCHNCGSKLDRSLLPKPQDKKESAEQARKRYKKMVNPGANPVKREFFTLIKVLVASAVVAALGLYWMPPEDAPDKAPDIGNFVLREAWAAQMDAPGGTLAEYQEQAVNEYFKTFKAEDGTVKFKNAFVKFSPGIITLWVKRDLFGMPMWSSIVYRPSVKDGKFTADPVSIHYGRLGVDPSLTFAHGWGVSPVLKALEKDFKSLERLQDVQVKEGVLVVITKPK